MKTSVALCTYNGEKFLSQQLDSILGQTISVDEIVVCDDGSSDSTLKILENYHQKFPNLFRIYRNEKNLRSIKNFEKAISLCNNEIIFLSDQDDVWMENKVGTYLEYFSQHSKISVLCSNGFGIDEDNHVLDLLTVWDVPKKIKELCGEINYFKIIAYFGNIATGASMAIKKDFLEKITPFPILEGLHHDEWIALVSSFENKFHMLDKKLFRYRIHENQQIGGASLKENDKKLKWLSDFLNSDFDKKEMGFYKYILKRLNAIETKSNFLLQLDEKYKVIFNHIFIESQKKHHILRNKLAKYHPVKYFFLDKTKSYIKKKHE